MGPSHLFFLTVLCTGAAVEIPANWTTIGGVQCNGPPDTGYSNFYLPDLLVAADGSTVTTAEQWQERRVEIKSLLMKHIFGSPPPFAHTPNPTRAVLVANYSDESRGFLDELWNVSYDGCTPAVMLTVEVMIPTAAAAAAPLPLFVTENTHRSWAMRAVERGYAAMITPTNDVDDLGAAFKTAFPTANWGDIIRRAWVVSRCAR
jgi:hypothetical protein